MGTISSEEYQKQLAAMAAELAGQKKIIESLRLNENHYRSFLDEADDLIHCLDREGRFLYTNRYWTQTLQYSDEELRGMKIFDIIAPGFQTKCLNIFECHMRGEKIGPTETIFIAKDGSEINVEGRCNVIFEGGEPVRLLGIFRDITSRKLAELKFEEAYNLLKERINVQVYDPGWEKRFKSNQSRDQDSADIEKRIYVNLNQLVIPYLDKLDQKLIRRPEKIYTEILKDTLEQISSSFSRDTIPAADKLTQRELEIVNLLRFGKASKEIGTLLGLSTRTVETHRQSIRNKLGLKDRQVSLVTYLQSIS